MRSLFRAVVAACLALVSGPVSAVSIPPGPVVDLTSVTSLRDNNEAVFALGDSITANGRDSGNTVNARTWLQWAAGQSGGRFFASDAAGFAGHRCEEIMATTAPSLYASIPRPGYVVLLCGTNDAGQYYQNLFQGYSNVRLDGTPVTLAKSLVDLASAYDALISRGYHVIAATIPPRSDLSAQTLVTQWNAGVKELARQRNIPVADFYSVLYDQTTALGGYLTGLSPDSVHPNGSGAFLMGGELARVMSTLPAGQVTTVTVPGAAYLNGTNQRFLVDSNSDGTPDGWGGFALTNATYALVTDGAFPNSKVWQITNTSDSTATPRSSDFTVIPGHYLAFFFRYKWTAAGTNPTFAIKLRTHSPAYADWLTSGTNYAGISMNTTVPAISTGGWLYFYNVVQVPTGITTAAIELDNVGNGSVLSVADMGVLDLTSIGVGVK